MATRRQTKKDLLHEFLQDRDPPLVSERDWLQLRALLAPVSDRYLRELLRSSGFPLAPLVEGVRQDNFDDLERTLTALQREYELAAAASDGARMMQCRRAVIEAKDHARLALRRICPEKSKAKQEMIDWMLVWLENPAIFSQWVRLRGRPHPPRGTG